MSQKTTNTPPSTTPVTAAAVAAAPDIVTTLEQGLKKVEIDGEKYFIAEGDLLIDQDELSVYALARQAERDARKAREGQMKAGLTPIQAEGASRLIGILGPDGKPVRWRPGTVLSYCVLKNTFTSDDRYELARENMAAAVEEWESTCGVNFEYRPELDDSPTTTPAGVLFTVREIDAGGRFIASAFFPNTPPNRRRVLIDPSYFDEDLGFDRVGVLRHELGHVIGFRHEQISTHAPAACSGEDTGDIIVLTEYDPHSVMHYFCGGVGTRELAITDLDRNGSQSLYGPPLNTFSFVDA